MVVAIIGAALSISVRAILVATIMFFNLLVTLVPYLLNLFLLHLFSRAGFPAF